MFGKDKDKDKDDAPAVAPDTLKSNEIARAVMGSPVRPDGFKVEFRNGTATVRGAVGSEADRQTVLNAVRGVGGVTAVTDALTIGGASTGTPGAKPFGTGAGTRSYTVVSGDTLSKIAKQHYGDANQYKKIFEANRKILSDPDKIQPGQVLTIPE